LRFYSEGVDREQMDGGVGRGREGPPLAEHLGWRWPKGDVGVDGLKRRGNRKKKKMADSGELG